MEENGIKIEEMIRQIENKMGHMEDNIERIVKLLQNLEENISLLVWTLIQKLQKYPNVSYNFVWKNDFMWYKDHLYICVCVCV